MKKISAWVAIFTLLFLGACKSDRSDLSDLLKTVPSSAGAVIGIHINDLVEDAGCKIEKNEIKPGKELSQLIDGMSAGDKKDLMVILNGDSGVAPESAILFYDASRMFITFLLYDTNKFISFVEKESGSTFSYESGVNICGNVAVKGEQAWICLSNYRRIDPDGIASYASLSSSQSFLHTDMAKIILESDKDIIGWGDFNSIAQNMLDRSSATMVSLMSGLLFEDVDAMSFSLDFEKGKADIEVNFIDDKGKPAKYLLPADKIDTKTVASLGGTCDGLFAFTITPKTIQKIDKLGSALGGKLFGDLKEVFKNIDGTIAVAVTDSSKDFNAIITTSGELSSEFKNLFSEKTANFSQDGKYLRISNGEVTGNLSVDTSASLLKDYCMAAVVNAQAIQKEANVSSSVAASFSTMTFGFKPDNGSIKLDIEIKAVDQNQNILISLLKSIK